VRARAKPRTRGRLSTCHCTLVLTVTVCISVCDSGSADRLGLTAMAAGSVRGRCARFDELRRQCERRGGCGYDRRVEWRGPSWWVPRARQGLRPGLGDGLRLVEVHGWHALESDGCGLLLLLWNTPTLVPAADY
jgi:hypothetical protein